MIPTSHDDMRMALEELDYDEIQSAFSPEIFYRGVDYCEEEAEQLSKKELVELLIRLAPGPLKKYIAGKNASETKAQNLLEQVKSRIEVLFRDDDQRWDPAEFDLQLSSELEILSGCDENFKLSLLQAIPGNFFFPIQAER